ncbi:cathepsin d-like aspartic protease [Plakobranchus ocellatus]|uniref:Cathepsin d-like aspartic protease n=1 Tax=Plakobranchus ocellatus TaxID=259542 RepID=A0AAV3YR99_9GAST|nr:cathepsin d-like aspartic protease [Plakobranchus ocellatus]
MILTPAVFLFLTLVFDCAVQVISGPFSPARTVQWKHTSLGKQLVPFSSFRERFQRPMEPLSKPHKRPIRDFRINATTTKDIKLANYYNFLYAPITIGTPGQKFNVAFDIGTPITWVPSIHSPYWQRLRLKEYNNYTSSTYKANGKPFEFPYRWGKVSGYRSQDNVAIAGVTVYNQTFGEAVSEPVMFFGLRNDGIFGLGFSRIAAGEEPTVFDNMVNKGLLPAPVFSFYLNNTCTDEEPDSDLDDPDFTPDPLPSLANVDRLSLAAAAVDEGASSDEEESRIRPDVTHQWRKRPLDKQEREFQNMFQLYGYDGPDSVLTLGGSNPQYYTGDFIFANLSLPDRWQFEIERIQPANDVGTACFYRCQAVIDTSKSLVVGPSDQVDALNKKLGAKPLGSQGGEFRLYSFDRSQLDSLPDLEFIVNGQKLTMTSNDYVVKVGYFSFLYEKLFGVGIPHIFVYTKPLIFINEGKLTHTTNRSLHFPVLSLDDAMEFLNKFD